MQQKCNQNYVQLHRGSFSNNSSVYCLYITAVHGQHFAKNYTTVGSVMRMHSNF